MAVVDVLNKTLAIYKSMKKCMEQKFKTLISLELFNLLNPKLRHISEKFEGERYSYTNMSI